MNGAPLPEWLYVLTVTRPAMLTEGPDAREGAVLAEHFVYLEGLVAAGTLVLAGRTLQNDASTMGLAILRAPSESAAFAIMQADPAVRDGVMTAVLHPFRVALLGK